MKKIILAGILAVFFTFPTQAQFLKKLQKKIEQRVEKTVTDKVADKAASETDKSMENLMNLQLKKSGYLTGFEQVDVSEIPESYEFDWKYDMEITSEEGNMIMSYYLKKDSPYFGMNLSGSADVFMVIDPVKNITVMFMNSAENKMITATKLPEISPEDIEKENQQEEFTYKQVGNKKILGYNCKGFQAENKEGIYTFYISEEPEVSFQDLYKNDKTKLPSGFDPKWIDEGKGLLMQMEMKDQKKTKNNTSMTCVGLEKQKLVINKSDYNSFAGN